MTKQITLTRKEQTITVVVRQLPHDEQAVVGRKFRYGSGAMWVVVEVR